MTELKIENEVGKFLLPPSGSGLCWKTLSENKVWEPETIEFIKNNIKGKSIITAGTYIGDFLPGFSANCRWIYGFEPDSLSYSFCIKNINLNGIKNATCANEALSTRRGESTLVTTGSPNAWARNYQQGESIMGEKSFLSDVITDSGITVRTVSIDEYVGENGISDLGIIHLDVEGHEREAILGAMNAIKAASPIIIVEEGTVIADVLPPCYKKANFTVGHDHFTNGKLLRFQNNIYFPESIGVLA